MRPRFTTPSLAIVLALLLQTGAWGQTQSFTMYLADSRRTVVVRTGSTPEMIALDQLVGTFGLTLTEDRSVNGLIIGTRGDRILASPGQSFVRAAGRVVALEGPVQRDRNVWLVPIDFLTKALGPSIGQPIVVRRSSRLILVGGVRVPEIGGRVERTASGARLVITMQPPTPYKVSREGNRLMVQFDATALDATPLTGFIPEFAAAARVDGLRLIVDLGPSAAVYREEDDRTASTLTIELSAAPPPPPKPIVVPAPAPTAPAAGVPPQGAAPLPPVTGSAGGLRTIVLDAGHGGQDTGTVGASGTNEKDVTLQTARRVKAAIESRLGLRVLLTRESDDGVTLDRRTELANNSKADLFVSFHTNWSTQPAAHGAQIYSPAVESYRDQIATAESQRRTVPTVGGGMRVIEPVPWDLAQLPFADESAAFASALVRFFGEKNVPLFVKPAVQAPMRVLMGANMPAVLIEIGFLSNADDERAMATPEWQAGIVDGVLAAITDLRRGPGPATHVTNDSGPVRTRPRSANR
ncbi:MAG TPA: N-acetylmuramoyl-L-alanine amidase [Vicinamibacterales bacterium]|nr:N-acetylmuramoyl-L-alanine amidase [Vicinamibacterales bacterium]